MPRPRPIAVVLVPLAFALAACGGEPAAPATSGAPTVTSSSPPASSPTPSASSASPTPSASFEPGEDVQLPGRAPTSFDGQLAPEQVPIEELLPRRTTVGATWTSPNDADAEALAFAWSRGEDPLGTQSGFEVWTRFPDAPVWRVTYAFLDRPSSGVLGVSFEDGDVTGDAVPDVLTFESTGGSGACGSWRVVQVLPEDATEIYAKQACDTDVRIVGGDLALREAVYGPDDAHCCPSAYRITTLRWTGDRWKVASRSTDPA